MIANFPDPYDGELFYSVLARFAGRMNYPTARTALREFFGNGHGVPAIELPNKINALVNELPLGTMHSSEAMIQKHTLFPLYAPFLPQRNYELTLASMKGEGHRTTQLRAGIIAGRINPPEFFRSCPVCDQEDFDRHGETYWRRLHQIRGIEVCPVHSVFLVPSAIRLCGSDQKDALCPADSAQRGTVVKCVDSQKPLDRFFMRVAKSAAWLLDKNTNFPGLDEVNRRHRELLGASDCLSRRGWVRLNRLRGRFGENCTEDWLKQLNCDLHVGSDGGWLARIFRETERAMAPLRHLLVMAALDVSAEQFFTGLSSESSQRPRAPFFPCLNPICPQHRALVIPDFQTKHTNYGFAHIFECPNCGHRSSRTKDGQTVVRIVSFGGLWMQKLKLLWADTSRSVTSISKELNADARSVTKYAAKLGLEFPRGGPRRATKRPDLRIAKRASPASLLKDKREAWCRLRAENPRARISALHSQAEALYTWLYRNDRRWLKENSPAGRRFRPWGNKVDWHKRDEELVNRVHSAAAELKSKPGRRRRVTVRSIGLKLSLHPFLQTYRHKLQGTNSALEANVESTEEFALFRIRRALEQFLSDRTPASHSDLLRAAGIAGSSAYKIPSVKQAGFEAKMYLDHYLRLSTSSQMDASRPETDMNTSNRPNVPAWLASSRASNGDPN